MTKRKPAKRNKRVVLVFGGEELELKTIRKRHHWNCNQCGATFDVSHSRAPKRCPRCRAAGPLRYNGRY